MSRDLGTDNETAAIAKVVRPALFAEFDFAGGMLRVWNGLGDFATLDRTFSGVGNFGGIGSVEEASDLSARGIPFKLSGIPTELLSLALEDDYRGRLCRLWLGFLDSENALIDDPIQVFAGRMSTMDIVEGGETTTITLNAENRLIDLGRARTQRLTNEEQQRLFPGDRGLEYVATLSEKPLYWGVANAPAVSPGTGGSTGDARSDSP